MTKDLEENNSGILITVKTEYLNEQNLSHNGRNFFSYTITIKNVGKEFVKLLTRHWIIIDADGQKEEVLGEGVIGYFPELEPEQSFTYTSFCPLDTNWGTMEGTYKFIRRDGTMFEATIPRFYLHKD